MAQKYECFLKLPRKFQYFLTEKTKYKKTFSSQRKTQLFSLKKAAHNYLQAALKLNKHKLSIFYLYKVKFP